MFEIVNGGAGAVASITSSLLVFVDSQQLLAYLEEQWDALDGPIEGQEALEDFVNGLGVHQYHLWVVEQGCVTRRIDLNSFISMEAGGERCSITSSESDRIMQIIEGGVERIETHFDREALKRALPTISTDALTHEDGSVRLVWSIAKEDTHLGETVRLGAVELGPRDDFFPG